MKICYKKLDPEAQEPQVTLAGMYLFASQEMIFTSGIPGVIESDLEIHIPEGYYGRITNPSGSLFRHFHVKEQILYGNKIVQVVATFYGTDYESFSIIKGDCIAELILARCEDCELESIL